jgi:hypothetical protein
MPRAKRKKPDDLTNLTKVHDRRAHDLLRNAEVAAVEVDNPLAVDPGDKNRVLRSVRNDPLAALHARRQIDEAQYHAGRAFQHDFETAERGPRAIDPGRQYVDGGRSPEPITEAQRKAVLRLNRAEHELGADGAALVHEILIQGRSLSTAAISRGSLGERHDRYVGQRFRECLDCLARFYGLATERK